MLRFSGYWRKSILVMVFIYPPGERCLALWGGPIYPDSWCILLRSVCGETLNLTGDIFLTATEAEAIIQIAANIQKLRAIPWLSAPSL